MKKRIFSVFLTFLMIFSLMPDSVYANTQASNVSRFTVLVLDVSGSMVGTPMSTLKIAAKKFCEQVLEADGENHVAITTYSDYAETICEFTEDLTTLQSSIDTIDATYMTNITSGLQLADDLLSEIPDTEGTKKNVLLLSDGLPNEGTSLSTGNYSSSDYAGYGYANAAFEIATTLKAKGNSIYTLGFFHSLYNDNLVFGQRFMKDLQNAGYYDVVDTDNLEFAFGEIATDIIKKTGIFTYASASETDYESTYYYDDSYFSKDSYDYNESLATMSLNLAMSAFASNEKEYSNKSDNAKDLLTQVGFSDFDTNDFYKTKPTIDSIGVVAANKEVKVNNKPYTLIAVATRGAGYEQEWGSNFTLGENGQHEGFNEAKNNVLTYIKKYIADNGISGDIKLWITGYSRGAATVNLVAGAIDGGELLGNCSLNLSDLYAYDFETPMGAVAADAKTNPVYKNIFNIINPSDPVPKVAPTTFGFRRYGQDKKLASPEDDQYFSTKQVNMLKMYNPLDSTLEPYIVDNFVMKKITIKPGFSIPGGPSLTPTIVDDLKNNTSQSIFLDTFITKLSKEQFKSRSNYVTDYQNGIEEVFKVLMGTKDDIDGKKDVKWTIFKEIFKQKLKSNIGTLIVSTSPIGSKIVGNTTQLIEKYAVESLNEAKITLYNRSEIHTLALTLTGTIIKFGVSHPNLTTTLICNLKGIGSAHYPELCLAWMQSMDKNYTTDAGLAFSNGSYRIIRINCPVDVEIYDASSNLVASIISDEPQDLAGSSIISAINEDGEKLIYLPANADYNLKIVPTGTGLMTYSVNEYSSEAQEVNRIANYYDVAIKPGDTLTSTVPAYSDEDITKVTATASSTVYSLLDTDNKLIAANVDLKGDNATEAYYMVNVVSQNETAGFVTGQGIRQLGNYAQINATAYNDYKFDGWYTNGQKISSETEYRFRVMSDVEITAKFISTSPVTPGDDPVVNVTSVNLNKTTSTLTIGDTDTLIAKVNPDDANNKAVTWKSSDAKVATVDNTGKVIAVGTGKAIITVTTSDGNKTTTCNVIVNGPSKNIQVISAIGSDRYDTAVKLSQNQFDNADTVVIVNGKVMADGLGATPLASYKNAPLLLTETNNLPKTTINEIKRLKAKNAIIVGGSGVVSDNVKLQMQALGLTVERISGNDRYGTSLEIAKYIDKNCYDVSKIVVSYGYGEADALSIASTAARDKMPLILVNKNVISTEVYDWLKSESLEDAYIIGGNGVVTDGVLDKINVITSANVINNRLGGKNRFETNALVIDKFYEDFIDKTYITKGYELIDALAVGPVAAINGSPVVLSGNDLSLDQKAVLDKRYGNVIIRTGGGISDTAVNSLVHCLR
ncbi:cell wall-binding repeat-containing protein [Clostridium sp.]|uniref:cell wall-binding repeat-containing protein n=1 Tax=Clostridium sp. TaxID=1506 RepID=UPI003D6CE724